MGFLRLPDYSVLQYTQPKQQFQFIILYELPRQLDIKLSHKNMKVQDKYRPEGKTILNNVGENRDYKINNKIDLPIGTIGNNDLLTLSTQMLTDFNWQIIIDTDPTFYNSRVHYSDKRDYDDSIQITFREYVNSPITRIINLWQKLANDPVTNIVGFADEYKGRIIKLEINPNFFNDNGDQVKLSELLGTIKSNSLNLGSDIITRQVIFEGVWPINIPEMGGNYSSDSLNQIVVSFSVDRYFDDIDWQRYSDPPLVGVGQHSAGTEWERQDLRLKF